MKKSILALALISVAMSFSQIKGNGTISRQNVISTEHLANAHLKQPIQQFRQQQLVPNLVISVDVKALYNDVADSYTAVFNIVQIGKTSSETEALMADRISKVKQKLLNIGILDSDIVTDVISFVPVYETVVERKLFSKKYNEIPVGFELQQNLNVKFKKVDQFENILSACASSEIYNLVKVDYFIDDIQDVYRKLREEILKTLKEKQAFYNDLGFDLKLYKPTLSHTDYCFFPRDFYKNYQAFNSISLEAMTKGKGVLKAKKQTSYYYDALSFRDYDIVINSSIVEPVIQIGMEIKIQYAPKPEEPKQTQPIENEVVKYKYFIISEDGDIHTKELKLES